MRVLLSLVRVAMVGGPSMYQEAVTARLATSGTEFLEPSQVDLADVTLVYCDTAKDWEVLAAVASRAVLASRAAVAVLPTFDPDGFVRALRVGAGVAHVASSSELVVAAVDAAAHGEVLLPMAFAQRLAAHTMTSDEADSFTALDRLLIRALADGRTIAEMVATIHYSDRTVRRRLQGLYLKLGVHGRGEAIEKIRLERLAEQFRPQVAGPGKLPGLPH